MDEHSDYSQKFKNIKTSPDQNCAIDDVIKITDEGNPSN